MLSKIATHCTVQPSTDDHEHSLQEQQMRDLGNMGESTFRLWCSEAGLVANGSTIDTTGWDFHVEFPYPAIQNPEDLHAAAIECKVQVKSSDKKDRKLPIKLSNLRRLATAQMPSFLVFFEFDGKGTAQRAFVVHIDFEIIKNVLKRIHEIEQKSENTSLHNKTITIKYDYQNEIPSLDGESLKSKIESFITTGMSDYVSKKKDFLESIGFENGSSNIKFTTIGKESIIDLIDVSIGIKQSVMITSFSGYHTRFGITSKNPSIKTNDGRLEMPDLKPTATGVAYFREDKLSPALCFDCRIFISPLSHIIPRNLNKIRIESDSFEIIKLLNEDEAKYSFTAEENKLFPIRCLRDTMRLLKLITSSNKKINSEFCFDGYPTIEFDINCASEQFQLSEELIVLEHSMEILTNFDARDPEISIYDLRKNKSSIENFYQLLNLQKILLKIDFSVEGVGFDVKKKIACISMVSTRIGTLSVGVILVATGQATNISDDRYQLITSEIIIERKISMESQRDIPVKELLSAIDAVKEKYSAEFEVVTINVPEANHSKT